MNTSELKSMLNEMKIDPEFYSLTGGLPLEALCIEDADGKWSVYYSERGARQGEKTFATESEACEYFLSVADDLR